MHKLSVMSTSQSNSLKSLISHGRKCNRQIAFFKKIKNTVRANEWKIERDDTAVEYQLLTGRLVASAGRSVVAAVDVARASR